MGTNGTQLVQLGIVARTDHAALADGQGRLFRNGIGDHRAHILQHIHLGNALQSGSGAALQSCGQGGQHTAVVCQRRQISCVGGAEYDAADDALHIPHTTQVLSQLITENTAVYQLLYGAAAVANGLGVQQGAFQPAAEGAAAHGGLGLIQYPQQAALLFSAAEGFGQL